VRKSPQNQASFAFNRGLVSPLGLARVEQKRVSLGARTMINMMPRVLGSMSFRPGLQYILTTASSLAARFLPGIFATNDTWLMELTNLQLRIVIDDTLLTRPAVSSTITNGTFTANITGWTASAGCTYTATDQMGFVGNGTADQTGYQTVTNASASVEHALRIVVNRGPVRLRVGSTVGGQEYITERSLDTGTHSIAFTPTGDFTIYFLSARIPVVLIGSCTLESSGVVVLPTPWLEADLGLVRYDQSADIVFCSCYGAYSSASPLAYQQRKIERQNSRSWGITLYLPEDGPFKTENLTTTTLTAAALTGDTTLTASKAVFSLSHVGSLFTLQSLGQSVTKTATVLDEATASIRVTGVTTDRAITIDISGTFDATKTIILERSFDDATWVAVATKSWTAATVEAFTDGLDNQIVYYRLRVSAVFSTTFTVTIASPGVFTYAGADNFVDDTTITLTTTGALPTGLAAGTTYWIKSLDTGANTFEVALTSGGTSINTTGSQSGTHTMYGDNDISTVIALSIPTGTIIGVGRVTGFTSTTVVDVQVLAPFGTTTSTLVWAEGQWSDKSGWPTAVRFHEGRLWWFGRNGIWGSVSDSYYSYSAQVVGDSGSINRTIGSGPVDVVNWALSLTRLIVGAQGDELSLRSSSLDEPLTPTNFNVKVASSQGSAGVEPVKIDQQGIFVQRGGSRVFELQLNAKTYDYAAGDLMTLVPELCSAGITRMAVQRQPDTRIHCCLNNANAAVMVRDNNEDVSCWLNIETDGIIEDVVVLPGASGTIEDQVYYTVKRTIGGVDVRYLEKWAKEAECRGTFSTDPLLNKQADSFVIYDGSNLTHLEGEKVVAWGNGVDFSPSVSGVQTTYTVASGAISSAVSIGAVVGLPYTGKWQSTKLGIQAQESSSLLTIEKRLNHLGLVMAYVHAKGIQYGADFTTLYDLPEIEQGTTVGTNAVRETYDEKKIEFPGLWTTDMSLCLQAQAPRPVTVLAAVSELET
jgi:hypothetical protein